ncbi:hypothetical protein MRX96_016136 [Rhipicephalus microplus]
MEIFELRDPINVSATWGETTEVFKKPFGILANNSDIRLVPIPITPHTERDFDFHVIRHIHDALYSRVVAHRVVSLQNVVSECSKLLSATTTLLALVVLVSVVIGGKDGSLTRRISDTSLFLMAAVLATSTSLPKLVGRMDIVPKTLIGLWLTMVVPLSVYFRSQMTALITLKRPPDSKDTLQELEDALDRREIVPCLLDDTHKVFLLETYTEPLPSVLSKLWFDFLRRSDDTLIKYSISECVQCASRLDNVCYDYYGPRATNSFQKDSDVRAFEEYVYPWRLGFLMPKFRSLYKALGKFFLDIEEHKLVAWEDPDTDSEPFETELDVSGLLKLLVTLHATSCLVLVLKVVVGQKKQRP